MLGPALEDSLELSHQFSKWSVASEQVRVPTGEIREVRASGHDERPAPSFPLEAHIPQES